jgi:hypothetical protein
MTGAWYLHYSLGVIDKTLKLEIRSCIRRKILCLKEVLCF